MIPRTKVNYQLPQLIQAFGLLKTKRDYCGELTQQIQAYTGEPQVLLMPSGRAGLYFLLKAIARPRVLIPAYTCKAVAEAAMLAGKEVVCVPVEADGFNLCLKSLAPLVDDQSVVIATHQFGFPCAIAELVDLCQRAGAIVIEDVAAALGSRVAGQLVGTFGDAAFYSFDSTKLINVPLKAGFITVKDPALFHKVRAVYAADIEPMPPAHSRTLLIKALILVLLENHGLYRLFHTFYFERRGKFTDDTASLNPQKTEFYRYAVTPWQAFIAMPQIANLDRLIHIRQSLYAHYQAHLADCHAFELPPPDLNREWACIRFPIRIRGDKLAYYQRAIQRGLDFAFSFTFIPCPDSCKNAIALADAVLDLPYYTKLSPTELNQTIRILQSLDREFRDEHH